METAAPSQLILIDGHALAYRSFFALQRQAFRTRRDNTPTWAVYGFLRAVLDVIKNRNPECLAVSFDLAAPTFRTEMYEKYKAHRPPMPDDLRTQLPLIKELVAKFGIPVYSVEGFEADDVIGSVAKRAARNGQTVYILTGDQDSMQLVEDHIRVLTPKTGVDGLVEYGPAEVLERYGVTPEQFVDYKALIGDTSDNIPGVPGIGPKTAVKLLQEFGTLDAILANVDQVKPPRIRDLIANNLELAKLSHTLSGIITDVPVDFDVAHCHLTPPPNVEELREFIARLEFTSVLRELPDILRRFGIEDVAPATPVPTTTAKLEGQTDEEDALWFDFQPETAPVERPINLNLTIVTELAGVEALVARIGTGPVAIDTETTGTRSLMADLVGISLAIPRQSGAYKVEELDSFYLPIGHALPTETVPQLPLKETLDLLRPVLENPAIPKLGHNLKYEMNVFSRHGIRLQGSGDDSMIADYLIDPERAHGLKEAALGQLGYSMTPISELIGTGAKAITMDKVMTERAASYAGADAAVTFELSHVERAKLTEMGLLKLYEDLELPLVQTLAEVEQQGVALDVGHLQALSAQLAEQLKSLELKVCTSVGKEFNLNSPKQLSTVLFDDLGLPTTGIKKNPSGGYSTDAAMLEKLAPKHEIVRMILEYRQLAKLKSTYADSLPTLINPHTGRLHTSLNQTVAATGRLSSTDPNLQNIPVKSELGREIRKAFIAGSPDCILLSADYSQIELRLLAHYSEDPAFLEAFRQGEDIHRRTAAEIFGCLPEQVTGDMRRIAKTVNFGVAYGQTAFGLAQTLNVPQKEAAAIIERFRTRYPRVQQYVAQMIAYAKEHGYVTTLTGRRRYLPDIQASNRGLRELAERMAINTPLQGTAADIIKMAMIRIQKDLTASGLEARMILQVHDELVFELPKGEVEPLTTLIRPLMEGVMDLKVPLRVDVNAGPTWKDAK